MYTKRIFKQRKNKTDPWHKVQLNNRGSTYRDA